MSFHMHKQYSIILELYDVNDKHPRLSYKVNNIPAENMTPQGARASVAWVFTW